MTIKKGKHREAWSSEFLASVVPPEADPLYVAKRLKSLGKKSNPFLIHALCPMLYACKQFSGRLVGHWFIMPCSEVFKFQGTSPVNPTISSLLVFTITLAFVCRCQLSRSGVGRIVLAQSRFSGIDPTHLDVG
jgi:hypothetical protein